MDAQIVRSPRETLGCLYYGKGSAPTASASRQAAPRRVRLRAVHGILFPADGQLLDERRRRRLDARRVWARRVDQLCNPLVE